MAIYNTFIHFTGCIINKEKHPKQYFPYLLSTESSFFSEMLFSYWPLNSTPYEHNSTTTNIHLMIYSDFYLPSELSIIPYYLKNISLSSFYRDLLMKMTY